MTVLKINKSGAAAFIRRVAWKWMQMDANGCKCMQMYANVCKCMQIGADSDGQLMQMAVPCPAPIFSIDLIGWRRESRRRGTGKVHYANIMQMRGDCCRWGQSNPRGGARKEEREEEEEEEEEEEIEPSTHFWFDSKPNDWESNGRFPRSTWRPRFSPPINK